MNSNELIELFKKRNYYFSVDKNGSFTTKTYDEKGRLPEFYIETNPNPKLSKVFVEFMSDMHPLLIPSLQKIISIDEKLKDAILKLDNNEKISIIDFVNKKKECESTLPEYLYHGTSLKSAQEILKNGLMPRSMTNKNAVYKTESSGESFCDYVYLCTSGSIGAAKFASEMASKFDGTEPIILKIDTSFLDKNLLMPDEDSKCDFWIESIQKTGFVAYNGLISNECISFFEKKQNKYKIK